MVTKRKKGVRKHVGVPKYAQKITKAEQVVAPVQPSVSAVSIQKQQTQPIPKVAFVSKGPAADGANEKYVALKTSSTPTPAATDVPKASANPTTTQPQPQQHQQQSLPLLPPSTPVSPASTAPAAIGQPVVQKDGVSGKTPVPQTQTQAHKPRKINKPKVSLTRPVVIASSITLCLLVCVLFFSWNRWLRFNDVQDFCGLWYANDTTKIVTATTTEINLTTTEAYAYTLDTGAKTITFSFGNMQGKARYRFTNNRQTLEIVDGTSFTFWTTLIDDTAWDFRQLIHTIRGEDLDVPQSGDGSVVLKRNNG